MLYKVISPCWNKRLLWKHETQRRLREKLVGCGALSPSDEWHGISTMQARKLTEKERQEKLRKWGVEDESI